MENKIEEKKKKDYFLPISILIAAILISGSLIYSVGKNKTDNFNDQPDLLDVDISRINLKDFSYLGKENAPVKIVEYSDFQCPFCNKFNRETFPYIKENYIDTGKVQFFYKDLAFLGPESKLAAEAARCAEEQNKFWQFHDKIFEIEYEEDLKDGIFNGSAENSGNLTKDLFINLAKENQLDVDKFKSCLDENRYQKKIEDEIKEAAMIFGRRLSTPSFLINNKIIQGAYPYSEFEKVIESELEKNK